MTVPIFCYIRLWADAEGPAALQAPGAVWVFPKNPPKDITPTPGAGREIGVFWEATGKWDNI